MIPPPFPTSNDTDQVQVAPVSDLRSTQPNEDGRQSPALSLAPSTVLTLNPPMQSKHTVPTVTFVLCNPPGRQHIVLPLPETYEGAIQALCAYYNSNQAIISGPTSFRLDPNQIVLDICLKTDIETQTATYAVMEPSLWAQLVKPDSTVQVWTADADGSTFLNGPVYLCFGKRAKGASRTVWTIPDVDDVIDRPLSYEHAVELVKCRIDEGGREFQEWKNKDLTHASFTFYTLTSFRSEFLADTRMDMPNKKPSGVVATMKRWFSKSQAMGHLDERVWTKLHPDIYDNEEIWRRWVPLPGACLGVIAEEREEHRV